MVDVKTNPLLPEHQSRNQTPEFSCPLLTQQRQKLDDSTARPIPPHVQKQRIGRETFDRFREGECAAFLACQTFSKCWYKAHFG